MAPVGVRSNRLKASLNSAGKKSSDVPCHADPISHLTEASPAWQAGKGWTRAWRVPSPPLTAAQGRQPCASLSNELLKLARLLQRVAQLLEQVLPPTRSWLDALLGFLHHLALAAPAAGAGCCLCCRTSPLLFPFSTRISWGPHDLLTAPP